MLLAASGHGIRHTRRYMIVSEASTQHEDVGGRPLVL